MSAPGSLWKFLPRRMVRVGSRRQAWYWGGLRISPWWRWKP